jgi:hypothetical protein
VPAAQHGCEDTTMVDVEGPQGPGDTSNPNPIDEHMHDTHAEVGLGQGPHAEPLQEQVADVVGEGGAMRGGPTEMAEASTASRHDQEEVMY